MCLRAIVGLEEPGVLHDLGDAADGAGVAELRRGRGEICPGVAVLPELATGRAVDAPVTGGAGEAEGRDDAGLALVLVTPPTRTRARAGWRLGGRPPARSRVPLSLSS